MTKKPVTITKDVLAAEALSIMEEKNIDALPVVEKSKLVNHIVCISGCVVHCCHS